MAYKYTDAELLAMYTYEELDNLYYKAVDLVDSFIEEACTSSCPSLYEQKIAKARRIVSRIERLLDHYGE